MKALMFVLLIILASFWITHLGMWFIFSEFRPVSSLTVFERKQFLFFWVLTSLTLVIIKAFQTLWEK